MRIALIPVKSPSRAKQRLATLLSPDERQTLALFMLEDVLTILNRTTSLDARVVITSDPQVASLAKRLTAEVIPDPEEKGETEAVALGMEWLTRRGADSVLVVPGDVPLLDAHETDRLISLTTLASVILVPSRDHRGTNGVVLTPPGVMPLRFGQDSFTPHLHRAKSLGLTCQVCPLPRLSLDIDCPADLAAFASEGNHQKSYQAMERMGIWQRLRRRGFLEEEANQGYGTS